jgi:multicomponent Na+:H+ antiporter subunit F
MSGAEALLLATDATLALLTLAVVLTMIRLVLGPTLADRILALDVITMLAVGYIAAFAIRTGFTLYLDIAISMGLLGFLSTVAFARFLLRQAQRRRAGEEMEQ